MSSQPAHILMLVNTHVYDDPRVIMKARLLAQHGYHVSIIGAARVASTIRW